MTIMINGEARSIGEIETIADVVRALKLVPETLLIEHNQVALHRGDWNARRVADGDRIELVRVVAGG